MDFRGIAIDGPLAGEVLTSDKLYYFDVDRTGGELRKIEYRLINLFYDWLFITVWTVDDGPEHITIPDWFERWALSALASAKRYANPKEESHGREAHQGEANGRPADQQHHGPG